MVPIRYGAGLAVVGSVAAWMLSHRSGLEAVVQPAILLGVPVLPVVNTTESLVLTGRWETVTGGKTTVSLPQGFRLRSLLVKPGDSVVAGQPLALLASSTFSATRPSRFSAQAEAVHAEQLSDVLGAALTAHESDLKQAESKLAQAKADYEKGLEVARSERDKVLLNQSEALEAADKDVTDATAARNKAKALSDRDARALEEGWISRNQATASKKAYDDAEQNLTVAVEKRDGLKKAASEAERKTALEKYRAATTRLMDNLRQAQDHFDQVKNGGLAFSGGSSAPVSGPLSRPVKGAIAGTATLRSPATGIVTSVAGGKIEVSKDTGSSVFLAKVPQLVADRISVGQPVVLAEGDTGIVSAIGPSVLATHEVLVRVASQKRHTNGQTTATFTVPVR